MGEPLILKRIRLINFISHEDTKIDFGLGVNTFIGPNGAGKSSILEAIYFAFTGKGWRTSGRERRGLVNENKSTATVDLEFTYNGDTYRIVRRIGAPGSAIYRNNKLLASGDEEINNTIKEILNIPINHLDKIVLIPQGGITRLFTELKPRERKDAIDRLLGLSSFTDAGEILGSKISLESPKDLKVLPPITLTPKKDVDKQIKSYTEHVERIYSDITREIDDLKRKINEKKRDEAKIREEIEKLKPKAEKLELLESTIETLKQKAVKIKANIENTEKEIRENEEELKQLEEEKIELEEQRKNLQNIVKYADIRDDYNRLIILIDKKNNLSKLLEQITKRLEILEKLVKETEEMKAKLKYKPEEIDDEIKKTEKKLEETTEEINRKHGEFKAKETNRENILKEIDRIKDKLIQIADLAEIEIEDIDKNLDELVERIADKRTLLVNKRNKLEKQLEEIKEKITSLETHLKINADKIRILSESREPRCPLCGQPLTEKHRNEIIKKLEAENKEYSVELEEYRTQYKSISRELENIRQLLEEIPEKIVEETYSLAREYVEKIRELDILNDDIKHLENILDKLRKQLEELKNKLDELHQQRILAEQYSRNIKELDMEELERLRNQYVEYTGKIESINKEIAEIIDHINKEINGKYEDPELVVKDLEPLFERIDEYLKKHAVIEERIRDINDRIDKLEKQVEENKKKLEELKKEYEEITHTIMNYEEELQEAKEASDKVKELSGKLEELEKNIREYQEQLSDREKKMKEIEEDVEKLNQFFRKAMILKWIRENLFSRDGVPKLLRRKVIRILEKYMEDFMEKFNLGFKDAEISEDYEISFRTMENPNIKRSITRLSGGEQVSMSMAAILALFYLVSGKRIGFLALDEPTAHLDERRQSALVELLKEFQGGRILPQLIIVTHDEAVKQAGDHVFSVYREGGFSRVVKIESGGEI